MSATPQNTVGPEYTGESEQKKLALEPKAVADFVGKLTGKANFESWNFRLRWSTKRGGSAVWKMLNGEIPSPMPNIPQTVPSRDVIRNFIASHGNVNPTAVTNEAINRHIHERYTVPNFKIQKWKELDSLAMCVLLSILSPAVEAQIMNAQCASDAYRFICAQYGPPSMTAVLQCWFNWTDYVFTPNQSPLDFVTVWKQNRDALVRATTDSAPSQYCQFAQFVKAVNNHPTMRQWTSNIPAIPKTRNCWMTPS
ncbi:hypothetical protein N7470_000150 [Penicillium chermesinum]|nr:hypothetical protein N7470_000150 [Penicillium chermesinum]